MSRSGSAFGRARRKHIGCFAQRKGSPERAEGAPDRNDLTGGVEHRRPFGHESILEFCCGVGSEHVAVVGVAPLISQSNTSAAAKSASTNWEDGLLKPSDGGRVPGQRVHFRDEQLGERADIRERMRETGQELKESRARKDAEHRYRCDIVRAVHSRHAKRRCFRNDYFAPVHGVLGVSAACRPRLPGKSGWPLDWFSLRACASAESVAMRAASCGV